MPGPLEPPAPRPHLGGALTQPQTLEPWEFAFTLCWSRDTSLEPAYPVLPGDTKMPRKWVRVWQMHQVYTHGTVLRTPVIWEGTWALELLGLDTRARTQVLDMGTNVAEIQRQAQMLQ